MVQNKKKRKLKRKRNLLLDWLGYAILRLVIVIMHRFSVERNLRFACFLGNMMYKHYERGRIRSLENLRTSFPEKNEEWLNETVRRSFQQIVMLIVDVLFTPRLVRRDTWNQYSKYINIEHAKWMMQGGQGVLFVTSHYGNFEIMGHLLGLFGFNIYSIARPLDNQFINNYLVGFRERAGQKILDKKGAADQMEQIIDSGSSLGFIADQDAGKKGVFVDFFGRKASTYKSIGLLAIRNNMPIIVAGCRRVEDKFFFEIEVSRYIMPDEWADKDEPLKWVTQEYVKATEDLIRKDPTQYWWLHRRWKTRPKEERRRVAAQK